MNARTFTFVAGIVAATLSAARALHAQSNSAQGETARVVNLVAIQMEQGYVFPEIGRRVAEQLRTKLRRGAYRGAPGEPLAKELSNDLRALAGDGHLSVEHNATALPAEDSAASAEMARRDRERYYGPQLNYGFRKMELLPGNVGYLDVTVFAPLDWAGPVATAAMTMVAQADALIIDLRHNGGGHGETVQWLESYLFERPQQVSGGYNRLRNTTSESWTLPWVPGPRFGSQKPVFILTSRRTFSAAEAMAYDLQALGRATIVGEASGGGAHPYENVKLDAHYVLGLPTSRSVNPITKGNWQGTGVRPDVSAPADSALAIALQLAHQRVGKP
jgi:C-terminal processing protease CtpA/Prc